MSAPWTDDELQRLEEMAARGVSLNRMVVRLGRSRRAVIEQMRRRRLVPA